ncbi:MAG: hypothetical protein LBS89_05685 [Zoogloeaceae bacterium]|jgi:hypothetical protein|nr:hypothetical protein [Zoogloeaceae bacterium]
MFDVHFAPCAAVGEMVIIDQTQQECVREHECPPGRQCPLDGCFADVSGLFEGTDSDLPLFQRARAQ